MRKQGVACNLFLTPDRECLSIPFPVHPIRG